MLEEAEKQSNRTHINQMGPHLNVSYIIIIARIVDSIFFPMHRAFAGFTRVTGLEAQALKSTLNTAGLQAQLERQRAGQTEALEEKISQHEPDDPSLDLLSENDLPKAKSIPTVPTWDLTGLLDPSAVR